MSTNVDFQNIIDILEIVKVFITKLFENTKISTNLLKINLFQIMF